MLIRLYGEGIKPDRIDMQRLDEIKKNFLRVISNLKKSVNKPRSEESLNKKLEEAKELCSEAQIIAKTEIEISTATECINLANQIELLVAKKIASQQVDKSSDDNIDSASGSDDNIDSASGGEDKRGSAGNNSIVSPRSPKMAVSFKDVEDSLETFDGFSRNVTEWFVEYEEVAALYEWTEVQKYLYCRRLLTGSAKLAVLSATNIGAFNALKNFLKEEFKCEIKGSTVHNNLRTMKKRPDETCVEFAYRMRALANRGKVDDLSLIEYIVGGLGNVWFVKSSLVEAQNFAELRNKLQAYDQSKTLANNTSGACSSNQRREQNVSRFGPTGTSGGVEGWQDRRCFKCGQLGHAARFCRGATKCFKCGKMGHISKDCSEGPSAHNRVQTIRSELPEMCVKVEINGCDIVALLDTGSDETLVCESVYRQIKNPPRIIKKSKLMTSFGNHVQSTLGFIRTKIVIDGDVYESEVQIVADKLMLNKMLIGRNVLKQTKLTVVAGSVKLTKICLGNKEVCENSLENMQNSDPFESLDVMALVKSNCVDVAGIQNARIKGEILKLTSNFNPRKPGKSVITMKITLSDLEPVYRSPYRLAPAEKEAVESQIEEWLQEGIIRNSNSDYASPMLVVKKKDGTNRLCIDFRKLNTKIIKDRYPLPIIEEVLERFCSARVFTTLDLRNGFFHVDIDEASVKYTAFVTPSGHYEFLKAPFGLCNSPSVFQRYVNTVLRELIRDNVVVVYMDDLIIASKDEEENLKKIKRVFSVAEQNGLKFRFDKCQFLKKRVVFLGHILEGGTIKPSEEKTLAVRHYPEPKNVREVQSFMGLASYFRKFIPGYSVIAKPLSDLTKHDREFHFGEAAREAMSIIKGVLCSDPILKIYDPTRETEVHTDASKIGYGACLLQKHGDEFYPVLFLSKKTTPAESNYSSYELEVLAVIYSLQKFRVYLLGLKFCIVTDCKSFKQTMGKRDLCPRIARWALQLEEFDCEVVHRSGTAMRHVDALSRFPIVQLIKGSVLEQIKRCQGEDKNCSVIIELLKCGKKYKDFEFRQEILYRFEEGNYLVVVPRILQNQIIRAVHESGHIGKRQVEAIVRQDYAIDKLGKKCSAVVANCVRCILSSRKAGKQEGLYNTIDKIGLPLHTYHIDHLGPLPSTAKSYQYLFVVVDGFTKHVWIYPVKNTTSSEAIKRLKLQADTFGQPFRVISDRGSAFTSNEFKEYCVDSNIEHVLTTTGVPRGNGQVERVNGIIVPALTKLSSDDPLKWYQQTTTLQRFINSTKSRSTGQTPFKLLFGVEMRNREDIELAAILEEETAAAFIRDRDDLRVRAKETIDRVQKEARNQSIRHRKNAHKYSVGDLTAIKRTQFSTGSKLLPLFMGPYRVTKVKGNDRYDVQRVSEGPGPKQTSTAADYMKPWATLDLEDSSDSEESGTEDEEDDV